MRKRILFVSTVIMLLLSTFVFTLQIEADQSTAPALHTSGNQILDANNNVVYLRGIGKAGELVSATGMWSEAGDPFVYAWYQKWQSLSYDIPRMDATFQCWQQYWHVNMTRIQIPMDWWWMDNVTPSNYQSGMPSTPVSFRTYIETLIQEAAKYGIYVDFCPYSAVNGYSYSGSFEGEPGSDPTLSNDWVPGTASYNWIQTALSQNGWTTQMQLWQAWWTSVVNNLGQYPNVIFEMWNEPGNNQASFFGYCTGIYNTIRSLGNQNLIFMQWTMGYVPTYNDLSWASTLVHDIGNPTNLVFTTHCYRYGPAFNAPWGTNYNTVLSQMQAAINSMGVNYPLVINEAGSCLTVIPSRNLQNEYNWWDGLNHAALTLGIGMTAYFWMSNADLGPAYYGEELVTGTWAAGATSPKPNTIGQTFINYASAVPTPTPSPSPTPAPTPHPTATPKPTPTPRPTATPRPTSTPRPHR